MNSAPPSEARRSRFGAYLDVCARVARAGPTGSMLPTEAWRARHRGLLAILWLHAPAVLVFAVARGYDVLHTLADVGLIAGAASAATILTVLGRNRRLCSAAVALGLLTTSALVVHFSGGVIEAHFHFFVMIALLLLYEDWLVFLLAVAYVAVHHGVLGELAPQTVYNHPDAVAHPWRWALVHAAFIAAASIANVVAWRLNEDVRNDARRARASAERNERLFAAAFDDAPIGIGILDAEGRWLRANDAMCGLLGRPDPASLGEGFQATTHPDDLAAELPRLAQLLAGEIDSYQIETRILRPTGDPLWALVSVSLARDPSADHPLRLIRHAQPITELKSAEAELRRAQRQYRSLVEQLPLVVYVDRLDDRSSNIYTSPQIAEMVGYTAEQWMSDPGLFVKLLHPDDREWVLARIAQAKDPDTVFDCEYRLIASDGREVWVRDRSVVVVDEDGDSAVAQGYLLDITQERELEERARQSQKMEAIGQLAGGIAHDFNNILTAIQGYCSLALERTGTHLTVRDDIEKAAQAAANASSLAAQLLAFSRQENFQTEKMMIDERVAATEALLRRVIGENVTLVTELGAPDAAIELDRGALEQILVNLVVNARDATKGHGRIDVATDTHELDAREARRLGLQAGRFARIAVGDDGCGMDAATQARIFEPFFTTKAVGEGTGLGLSTVYGIVQRSKGAVSVRSARGAGTTIEVWLPLHEPLERRTPTAEAPAAGGEERVLLVEDDPTVRDLVAEVLERRGYSVVVAETPARALELASAASEAFDVVVTDVVMPETNGRQLVDALRETSPRLPVVYMSGYADDIIHGDGLRDGERFLQKPFELSTLAATIREAIDEVRPRDGRRAAA